MGFALFNPSFKLIFCILSVPYTMQLVTCNLLHATELHRVLEMLRVACSVKLFHANRIVVYSLQLHGAFKGFTRNAATDHLSRHGDYSETQRFYSLASVGTKMTAFSWTVAKIDVLQVRRRRSCRYGEQPTIFILVRRRPTTSLNFSYTSDRSARVQYICYKNKYSYAYNIIANFTCNIDAMWCMQKLSATCCTLQVAHYLLHRVW